MRRGFDLPALFAEVRRVLRPGESLPAPPFRLSVRWTADDLLRFVRTWSGVQAYIAAEGRDPVDDIAGAVREVFDGDDSARTVGWPLYLKASRP